MNAKVEKSAYWGYVSPQQMVELFDRESDLDHTFTKDVYNERDKEINECAARAGFVKVQSTHKNAVVFRKK